jgi:hypothetical protein
MLLDPRVRAAGVCRRGGAADTSIDKDWSRAKKVGLNSLFSTLFFMKTSFEALRGFRWGDFGVVFAVLFDSRLRGSIFKGDWDVAVWLKDPGDVDAQCSRVTDLRALSLPPNCGFPQCGCPGIQ